MEVARTILAQLGGSLFIRMTGSKQFVGSDRSLSFKVGKNPNRITHFRVTLDGDDTYTVESMRYNARRLEMNTISSLSGVYCDMLQDVFTSQTGLYTKL